MEYYLNFIAYCNKFFYLSTLHYFTDTRFYSALFTLPFASTAMDLKAGGLLVPPTVKNSSCSHPRYTSHNFIAHIGIAETIEAVLILILTLGVIGANALVIFVINNRRYSPYIHQQVSVGDELGVVAQQIVAIRQLRLSGWAVLFKIR